MTQSSRAHPSLTLLSSEQCETIHRASLEMIRAVGPGGYFLTHTHTLKHFRGLWQPHLFDRRRWEDWAAAGSPHLGQRLRDKTVAIMDGHRPPLLPEGVRQEVDYVLQTG